MTMMDQEMSTSITAQRTASIRNLLRFNAISSCSKMFFCLSVCELLILFDFGEFIYCKREGKINTVEGRLCQFLAGVFTFLLTQIPFFFLYQVLKGKDLNIKMFGYSLAGNMDLDNNQYPDLAIGSLSDTVVMYR